MFFGDIFTQTQREVKKFTEEQSSYLKWPTVMASLCFPACTQYSCQSFPPVSFVISPGAKKEVEGRG